MFTNTDKRTIRHAMHGLYMVLNGAVRDLENQRGPNDGTAEEAVAALFSFAFDQIAQWDVKVSKGSLLQTEVDSIHAESNGGGE